MIDIESMGESALKSHMKGEKHKRNAGASSTSAQSVLMTTFLHKERSSSWDQRLESGPSSAEVNNDEFCVPPPPLLMDVKDVAHWRILWEKMTCSLLRHKCK